MNTGGFHFRTKNRNYTTPYQKKLGFNESVCIQCFFHSRSDIFLWQFIILCSLAVWDLSYLFIDCYTRLIKTKNSNSAFFGRLNCIHWYFRWDSGWKENRFLFPQKMELKHYRHVLYADIYFHSAHLCLIKCKMSCMYSNLQKSEVFAKIARLNKT